ncbi:methyltransferase domain-containing protein [Persicimonas caeni]|uniref:Methyltransferase domain-containing protein n=1 Tax=Persicimonas caeni TaxID=2292766 RepID=A0A4Y6Q1S7_PERCE|nr:methyltransferase domain-containing protein [Persicimonas caeni]QDG53955.1 methyltransferase domain-containing protein [Persicimonas caeni]QED35176.1 methyltransferase domain-containing protein [Persicimonas caeni]
MTKIDVRHRHVGAYALLVENDAVLLVRKQRGPYRGCWDLPGGGLETNESPVEALFREVQEETGLRLDAPQPLTTTVIQCCHLLDRPQPEELLHVALIYRASSPDAVEPAVVVDNEDVSHAVWLPLDQLPGTQLTPIAQEALTAFSDKTAFSDEDGIPMTSALSPGQRLLQTFHQRHAGATTKTLARGRTESGRSSYEMLCSVATSAERGATVLDLACGDGFLLELVHEQLPDARLIGVDVSDAELEAARARLALCEPELLNARAQELPLADASIDVVLCHMSLMLMEEVEEVVAEIGRVLRPGGVVGLIVSDGSWPAGIGRTFKCLMKDAVAQFGGACPRLGDNRTRTEEGLLSLFGRKTGFEARTPPQSLTLELDADTEQVWESLSLMYNFAALDERGRDFVKSGFFDAVDDEYGKPDRLPYRTSLLFACFERLGRGTNRNNNSSSWTRLGEGTLTEVWTDGAHIRRPLRPWSQAVHQLLDHLEQREVAGVPRFVAIDGSSEILTHLHGQAVLRPWPEAVQSSEWMEQVGRWLRQVHESTADFQLTDGVSFAWGPTAPEPAHVVTHGDLGPWNMIVDDGEFSGVIDWDMARFGDPLDDVAEVAFELGPLRENRGMLDGDISREMVRARVAALCRGYGQVSADKVLRHVEPFYRRRIGEMPELAADDREPFVTLADAGNIESLCNDLEHFRDHFQ